MYGALTTTGSAYLQGREAGWDAGFWEGRNEAVQMMQAWADALSDAHDVRALVACADELHDILITEQETDEDRANDLGENHG